MRQPNDGRVEDEEPTDPMLEDPPGRAPARPSLAPSLSTRISEIPRAPTIPPPTSAPSRLRWLFGGGLLLTLALAVLVLSRMMAPSTETLPVIAVTPPVPVPDPEPVAAATAQPDPEPAAAPEPVPDPTPEAPPSAAPTGDDARRPSTPAPPQEPELEEAATESPPEHLAVIVHPENPVQSLSAEEIRRIYLEDRTWPEGGRATPVGRYLAPALRKVFLELVLGTNHQAIKDHWEEKKAEGLERVRRLPSDEAVVQLVSRRPETLGYVDWAKLTPEQRAQVKLVFEIRLK